MIAIERLVLGTAKLGLNFYGYHSTSRPTAAEAIAILRHAWRSGVRAYDTALGYGDALYLLADAGIPAEHIICKCRPPLTPNVINGAWSMHWLIHNPTLDQIADTMAGCGVSIYTVEEVERARRLNVTPIQAPASCLNPRVDVEYGRAPFLQGVLLRPPALAPEALRDAVTTFQLLASSHRLSPVALAIHAAWGERLVVGVSSIKQLDEVLAACGTFVPTNVIAEARALASTVDATAALPSLWSVPRA